MIEIRPATPDEMPEFARVVSAALARPASDFRALQPAWTLCAFEDDQLATGYGAWPLQMRFNGKVVPIAAVTTVSTAPVYRNRGYLRQITTRHFHQLFEQQQQPIAALYASQAAIYQRYGYAVVSTHHRYSIEPRELRFARPLAVTGRLRETTAQREFPLLVDLYRRFREDRTGYVHRGAAMWEAGVLAEPTGIDRLAIAVYEEGGEALGYAVYVSGPGAAPPPEPDQRLIVRDLIWLTPAAYRALWQHFAQFQLVWRIDWGQVPADDPLPHLLLEPRMLRDTSGDGVLARIVDLPRALVARGYPHAATLRFAIEDDLCPWNSGAWELVTDPTSAEGAAVSRLPAGANVDLSLDPSTLAMLLFAQISAGEAARMGRLEVHNGSALDTWDAALRTTHRPFSADHW